MKSHPECECCQAIRAAEMLEIEFSIGPVPEESMFVAYARVAAMPDEEHPECEACTDRQQWYLAEGGEEPMWA